MKKNIKRIILGLVLVSCIYVAIKEINSKTNEVMEYMPITNKTIVLDAGHGGADPGSLNKEETIYEKDVNLAIVLKLRELIESSGGMVILTREQDDNLYIESGDKTRRQKYNESLKNRKQVVVDSKADIFVSIHLNKFEQEKYYGAQTFYPKGKDESKILSQIIQEELKRVVDETNNREIKPTDDIYMLKDNDIPSILIECGFLSNTKEAELLTNEEYQEKIAWAIYVGIQRYFS